ARNIAAPKNAQRLGAATPCAKEGDRCYGCRISNPKSICRALVVLEQKPLSVKKMEILLLDEVLGY
ncbi:MAG TPA: lactate utilization protein, partial [Candidatus Butyricicoccus avicola]|nr:lactate utilization protein [Candidatus Butyricicoccus avicola]